MLACLLTFLQLSGEKPFLPPYTKGRFILHYYAGSLAEKDRDALIAARDKALAKIEQFFKRKLTAPVHLLVYPTQEDAAPFPVGRTTPEKRWVHIAYKPGKWDYEHHNPGHELTHLLAMTDPLTGNKVWALPLLNEGLAEYLAGGPVDLHLLLTDYMQSGGAPARKLYIDGRHLYDVNYAMSGSFAKFLIEHYPDGRNKILRLLERTRLADWKIRPYFPDFLKTLEEIFETDYVALMDEWNRVLQPYWAQSYAPPAEDRTAIEQLLGPVEQIRYFRFGTNLELAVKPAGGKWTTVEAAPEGWKVK